MDRPVWDCARDWVGGASNCIIRLSFDCYHCILLPQRWDSFGQHHESSSLAGAEAEGPQNTDFRLSYYHQQFVGIQLPLSKWNNQHITSLGQRRNLSPRQNSNLWPPKHVAGALSSWATENSWRARPYTRFIFDPSSMQDSCPTLVTCWLFHFHTCFTELKVYHPSFLSTLPLVTKMEWPLRLRVLLAPASAFDPWRCEQGSQPSLFYLSFWSSGETGSKFAHKCDPTPTPSRHVRIARLWNMTREGRKRASSRSRVKPPFSFAPFVSPAK